MDYDEEMRKLQNFDPEHPGLRPPSLRKMAHLTAMGLYRMASRTAFSTWNDRMYRSLIGYDALSKTEQDRIFNELVGAGLSVIMLTLDAPDLRVDRDLKEYYALLRDELPRAHLSELKRLGVEKKFLKIWEKLIATRYGEYSEAKLNARSAAMEYESQGKPLTRDDLDGIHLFLPAFTVAVGCHKHIFRGKTEGHDLAFKLLMKKLSRFYVPTRAAIEGHTISPTIRLRMAVRHFLNDFKDWPTYRKREKY